MACRSEFVSVLFLMSLARPPLLLRCHPERIAVGTPSYRQAQMGSAERGTCFFPTADVFLATGYGSGNQNPQKPRHREALSLVSIVLFHDPCSKTLCTSSRLQATGYQLPGTNWLVFNSLPHPQITSPESA